MARRQRLAEQGGEQIVDAGALVGSLSNAVLSYLSLPEGAAELLAFLAAGLLIASL